MDALRVANASVRRWKNIIAADKGLKILADRSNRLEEFDIYLIMRYRVSKESFRWLLHSIQFIKCKKKVKLM